MARFYFHLQDGGELIPHPEGTELPDCDTAKQEALHSARELLSNAIRAGKPKVPEAFVIADEAGQMLDVVPLAAVLPETFRSGCLPRDVRTLICRWFSAGVVLGGIHEAQGCGIYRRSIGRRYGLAVGSEVWRR